VNWKAGLVNFVLILLTMQIMKVMFVKQRETQEGFALAQKKNNPVSAMTKVGARIKSAELGTLVANGVFVLSLGVLLAFSYLGHIAAADAVMLFLGFRMQNSNIGQISGSLMRWARAKAMREAPHKYRNVKADEDEDEIG
jgi:short subunit fatty acids transporter